MDKLNGGPAFPRPMWAGKIIRVGQEVTIDSYPQTGMTLRQWYAGKALQGMTAGIFSNVEILKAMVERGEDKNIDSNQVLAKDSYDIADAMIAEGNKE